jgi:hypothetical protein
MRKRGDKEASRQGDLTRPRLTPAARRFLLVLLSHFLLVSSSLAAEFEQKNGPAMLRVKTERIDNGRVEMRLSDRLSATISIEGRTTLEVQPPEKIVLSPDWELDRKSKPQKTTLADGRVRWQQTFTLNPIKTGDLPLQLEPLVYREDAASENWEKIVWQPIPVHVGTEILEPDLRELRDATPPEQLPPLPVWRMPVLWAALPLAAVALCLGIVYYRRYARRPAVIPPQQWAMQELDRISALSLASQHEVEQFYTLLSDVLRKYLEARYQVRAQEQTTAEFIAAIQHSPHLTTEEQHTLHEVLERCDLAKFAREIPPAEECQATIAAARGLIAQTAARQVAHATPGEQA